MQHRDESDAGPPPILTSFAFDPESGVGRHSGVRHIVAKLSESGHQHVQFMIYRRRVVETWPESASKTARLAAIDASISSLGGMQIGT